MTKASFARKGSRRCNRLLVAAFAGIALLGGGITAAYSQGTGSTPASASQLASVSTDVAPIPPENKLSLDQLGDLEMVRRHYQAALQDYQQILPKSSITWNKIGIAYQQMYVTEEARKSYLNALKLDPRNADAMNNLGSIYYSLANYKYAERMYRKALKINPKSALIYKNLGTNFLAASKFKKGWECYQQALTIDPGIFERVNQLRIGEPTPAQKRGAMNYYLAKSYMRAGMPDLAVGYLRLAIGEGFADRKKIMADKEFASLYTLESFRQLMAEQQVQ